MKITNVNRVEKGLSKIASMIAQEMECAGTGYGTSENGIAIMHVTDYVTRDEGSRDVDEFTARLERVAVLAVREQLRAAATMLQAAHRFEAEHSEEEALRQCVALLRAAMNIVVSVRNAREYYV